MKSFFLRLRSQSQKKKKVQQKEGIASATLTLYNTHAALLEALRFAVSCESRIATMPADIDAALTQGRELRKQAKNFPEFFFFFPRAVCGESWLVRCTVQSRIHCARVSVLFWVCMRVFLKCRGRCLSGNCALSTYRVKNSWR